MANMTRLIDDVRHAFYDFPYEVRFRQVNIHNIVKAVNVDAYIHGKEWYVVSRFIGQRRKIAAVKDEILVRMAKLSQEL